MKNFLQALFLICTVLSAQGCVLAPILDSVGDIGITPGDRRRLFGESVKGYTESLLWGDLTRASVLVAPAARPGLLKDYAELGRGLKVVDSRVDSADFDEETRRADAIITLRSYRSPYFVIEEQREQQVWEFDGVGSWTLTERTPLLKSPRG